MFRQTTKTRHLPNLPMELVEQVDAVAQAQVATQAAAPNAVSPGGAATASGRSSSSSSSATATRSTPALHLLFKGVRPRILCGTEGRRANIRCGNAHLANTRYYGSHGPHFEDAVTHYPQ